MLSKLLIVFLGMLSLLLPAAGQAQDKPQGYVERAQFTSAVENREPVDLVTVLGNDHREIRFFTDLRQLAGRTVTHRWEYQGKVMAEIPFQVGGPRWRVYSSKTLLPDQLGKWTVVVVDQSGWPLQTEVFEYRDAAKLAPDAGSATVPAEPVLAEPAAAAPLGEGRSGE